MGGRINDVFPGSARDIESSQLWDTIRDLEARMSTMKDEYENKISSLQEEVKSLQSQLEAKSKS